jgi:hypothetical protein
MRPASLEESLGQQHLLRHVASELLYHELGLSGFKGREKKWMN